MLTKRQKEYNKALPAGLPRTSYRVNKKKKKKKKKKDFYMYIITSKIMFFLQ
jgi:hypothetical protein